MDIARARVENKSGMGQGFSAEPLTAAGLGRAGVGARTCIRTACLRKSIDSLAGLLRVWDRRAVSTALSADLTHPACSSGTLSRCRLCFAGRDRRRDRRRCCAPSDLIPSPDLVYRWTRTSRRPGVGDCEGRSTSGEVSTPALRTARIAAVLGAELRRGVDDHFRCDRTGGGRARRPAGDLTIMGLGVECSLIVLGLLVPFVYNFVNGRGDEAHLCRRPRR